MKMCEYCNEVEIVDSYGRKYCKTCADTVRKENARERSQLTRERKGKTENIRLCTLCKERSFSTKESRLYCVECREDMKQEYSSRGNKRKQKINRKKFDDNFNSLDLKGLDLIPTNFSKRSSLSAHSYTIHFKMNWFEVLERYEKVDSLSNAIKRGFSEYVQRTGKTGLTTYTRSIGINSHLLRNFKNINLRELANTRNIHATDEDRKENFFKMIESLGRPPYTMAEFKRYSDIGIETYKNRIDSKTNHLGAIVEFYLGKCFHKKYSEDREKYIHNMRDELASENQGVFRYSKEDYMERVGEVVEDYIDDFGVLPSTRDIQRIGGLSSRSFKKRFNMSLGDVLDYLGYKEYVESNKTEYIVVKLFSKILKEDFTSQKTFDWLKGDKGWALRCDAYFPTYKLVVEYDGEQHSLPVDFAGRGEEWAIENMKNIQRYEAIKNKLIPHHGITLIRIAYDEPYYDKDFLRMRLFEHGVMPPKHILVSDNSSEQTKIA